MPRQREGRHPWRWPAGMKLAWLALPTPIDRPTHTRMHTRTCCRSTETVGPQGAVGPPCAASRPHCTLPPDHHLCSLPPRPLAWHGGSRVMARNSSLLSLPRLAAESLHSGRMLRNVAQHTTDGIPVNWNPIWMYAQALQVGCILQVGHASVTGDARGRQIERTSRVMVPAGSSQVA